MQFDVKDTAQHSDFFTPHALFHDKKRNIQWAALLRPTGVAVYLALLHHAGYQSRTCYPSESLLARETGLSLRQVKREIKRLIAFGMITKTTPRQKTDLFELPAREKLTNTYTITDKKEWRVPADAQFKTRTDKGRRRKTAHLEILAGDSQSPEVVTDSHLDSDSQSPEVVTDSHLDSDSQSPEVVTDSHLDSDSQSPSRCLTVTQNRSQLINPIEITPSTSTTPAATESAPKDDVDVDVDAINAIFSNAKRQERLTPLLLTQIMQIHALESPAEILLAARALAPDKNIRSVIAVLKGKRTPDGYESGCFAGGKCYLYAPDAAPAPPIAPDAAPRVTAAELRERIAALDDTTRERVRRKVVARLESHRAAMKPDAYADTLKFAMQAEFEAIAAGGA